MAKRKKAGKHRRDEDEKDFGAFLKKHWHIMLVILICVAAFLVRLHYLSLHSEYTTDSYYYMILARSLKETFSYTERGAIHTKYLPGYPLATLFASFLAGGIENGANLVAILFGSLTALVAYGLGLELFGKWVGVCAALLTAFIPTFLKWTCLPMTEGLFTFLFCAGLYFLLTGCKRGSFVRRIVGAVLGGFCFLTRWEGGLFLPVALLVVILYARRADIKKWEPLLLIGLFCLPIGIYVIRNLVLAGRVSSYFGEYKEYKQPLSLGIIMDKLKLYAIDSMGDPLLSFLFYGSCAWAFLRKRWKPLLILVVWFGVFAGFHVLWHYPYERFMAPAVPALAVMVAFLFVDFLTVSWGFLKRRERRRRKFSAVYTGAEMLVVILIIASLGFVVARSIARSDAIITPHYKALADDHGGKGMRQAAEWLLYNAPGSVVGVDAGPLFAWEYHPGKVLYLRPVPWDLPVEGEDVSPPRLLSKLREKDVDYLVIGQTERGVQSELLEIGFTPDEIKELKMVKRFVNHYDPPAVPKLETAIFSVG
ncbi:MAG: glycosyltransferase family 39 protein [Actinomycetota bacterium]|nr:glycosyltransferase family 39 protein [Actinomycetota bacterium]